MLALFYLVGVTTFAMIVNCQQKPECVDDMITFAYTECDSNTGRWRVSVPRNDQCQITNPAPPVFGKECGFSCARGEYLDLNIQQCKRCPAGTYSLGNAIRFNTWNSIPDGFTISSNSFSFNEYGYHSKVANCTGSGWKAEKDYISSNDNDCISSISYAVDVKFSGSVSFTYQCTDEDLIFHFYVQNSECQTVRSGGRNVFLNTTGTSWQTYVVDLVEGTNVLTWKTTGLLLGSKEKLRPALIKDIEISGVSYSTSCHQCLPGFFSDTEGSDWCKPCPTGTYSKVRAAECTPCSEVDQYSLIASSSCMERPACTEKDYFETHLPCKSDKTTQVTYKWRDPKICRDDVKQSVKLPESGVVKECPPCNPGFHMNNATGVCLPCPELTYSDGAEECGKCGVGTSPNHVFHYKWWDVLPANMRVSCMTVHSEDCVGMEGWVSSGGMIKTSINEITAAYLLLKLRLDGFHDYKTDINGAREYGRLTFVFELICHENCVLYLMKNSEKSGTTVLGNWHGATEKTIFTHVFIKNEKMNLTWAFQKTNKNDADMQNRVSMDSAVIYSITVTNAIGSPADVCASCATGVNDKGCIPCPAGHFVDSSKKQCVQCPPNTYLATETAQDSNCTICLNGTEANDARTACQNDCKYTSEVTGRLYEFSMLKNQVAITPPSFTDNGRKYVHYYNFSVCGNDGVGSAECFNNKSLSRNIIYGAQRVKGMVCRSTKLFTIGANNDEITVFSQPLIISVRLQNVYHANASHHINGNTCMEGEVIFPYTNDQEKRGDIVFVFSGNSREGLKCTDGMKTYLHLRCDPTVAAKDAIIETPVKYPDGSCDGCNFHFIWKSPEACPLCTKEDYYSVTGVCEDGFSTTRYLWKSYTKSCKDGVTLPDYSKVSCVDSRLYVEIGVLGGIVLLVVLLALSCSLWKKSRSLEYKYQKLMMNSGKDGGELPTADRCAISSSESDDSDNEEVMFRKKREKALRKSEEKIPLNTMHHSVNM